jgi:hypothetical protein
MDEGLGIPRIALQAPIHKVPNDLPHPLHGKAAGA